MAKCGDKDIVLIYICMREKNRPQDDMLIIELIWD